MNCARDITVESFPREELPAIVRWRNDPAVNKYLRPAYRTLDEVQEWFDHYFAAEGNKLFAIRAGRRLVGYCTIEQIERANNKCEVGIVIDDEDCWRRGIGSEVVRRLLDMAFNEMNMHRVEAVIQGDNAASVGCFESLGFHLDARLRDAKLRDGQYVDLLVYSMLDTDVT